MNGTFLIALGAIWGHVELPPRVEKAARWSALYGTYGNWLFIHTWCRDGYSCGQPHLVAGPHGKPWQERILRAPAFAASPIRSFSPWF